MTLGSFSAPIWTSAAALSVASANNLVGGNSGYVPYQSAASTTAFVSAGTTGQVFTSGGTGTPTWTSQSALSVGTATNIAGGSANQIHYQTGAGATSFITAPTVSSTYLQWSGSAFIWTTLTTSAGGSNTQVQYNSGGSLAGSANMVFNGSTLTTLNSAYTGTLTGGTGVVNLGSGQFYKDSSGNVGIGATLSAWATLTPALQIGSSSAFLASQGSTEAVYLGSNAYFNSTWKYGVNGLASYYRQQNGVHSWYTAPTGTAGNTVSFTEAMRIDASGNLLVGTTSVAIQSNNSILLNIGAGNIIQNHTTSTPSGTIYTAFGYGTGAIGTITQNGTTGVLYNLTSDYRLKDNPVPLTGALEFIMALQPKSWDWWDGSGKGVGFIAHEFMEVAKHSGNGEKDAIDAQGKPVYQSIQPSSSEVMANLVSLVQEQQALITDLQTRLTKAGL
jgi:hypothetical protein